mmetsp:Transcript_11077/g.16607  ORF Transcript_11077/g.16607 Transcript_11077/m.16607 type:complete len:81 (-) Transcript_11077:557-799(-)
MSSSFEKGMMMKRVRSHSKGALPANRVGCSTKKQPRAPHLDSKKSSHQTRTNVKTKDKKWVVDKGKDSTQSRDRSHTILV